MQRVSCPVCRGDMTYERWPFLTGSGLTPRMWDCEARHHATTEPQVWQDLKVQALLADLREALEN